MTGGRAPRTFIAAFGAAALIACSGGGSDSPASPTSPGGGGGGGTTTTGTISGRVSSSTGAALVGAAITTLPATSSTTTDALGNYSIVNVAPGSYAVSATLSGYTNATANASVAAGQTASANITMQVIASANTTKLYLAPLLSFKLRATPIANTGASVELCLSTMEWAATLAEDIAGTSYTVNLGVKTAFTSSGSGTLRAEIIHKRGSTETVLATTTFTTTSTYEVKSAVLTGPDPSAIAGDNLLLRVRIVTPSAGLPCVADFNGPGTDNFIVVPRTTVAP